MISLIQNFKQKTFYNLNRSASEMSHWSAFLGLTLGSIELSSSIMILDYLHWSLFWIGFHPSEPDPFSQKILNLSEFIQDELLREDPFTSVLTLQTRLRNLLRTSVVRCSENIYFLRAINRG